jgi:hypothetical protein
MGDSIARTFTMGDVGEFQPYRISNNNNIKGVTHVMIEFEPKKFWTIEIQDSSFFLSFSFIFWRKQPE